MNRFGAFGVTSLNFFLLLREMKTITSILLVSPPYIFSLVILLAICWLTLVPKPLPDSDFQLFPGADKVAHFIMFGAFSGALFIDMMRAEKKRKPYLCALFAAGISIALGASVEYLQEAMCMGRSSEPGDVIADSLGAVCASLLFFIVDKNYFRRSLTECKKCDSEDYSGIDRLKNIYIKSFPEAERRDWNDIISRSRSENSPMNMTMVILDGAPVGFITSWDLKNYVYIEHFVIDPALRNRGIGAKALKRFCDGYAKPVVLEAEPESLGEDAKRRIKFYKRLGFYAFSDFNYIQPPYKKGLPSVPLILLSSSKTLNPEEISSELHRTVYEQD